MEKIITKAIEGGYKASEISQATISMNQVIFLATQIRKHRIITS